MTLHFGWRHVFLLSVPIGIAGLAMCLFGMRETEKNGRRRPMHSSERSYLRLVKGTSLERDDISK